MRLSSLACVYCLSLHPREGIEGSVCGFLLWCHNSVTCRTRLALACARCEISATSVGWSKGFMLEPQLPSVVHYVMPKGLGGALAQGNTAATVLRDADSETEKVLRDDSNLICMLSQCVCFTHRMWRGALNVL